MNPKQKRKMTVARRANRVCLKFPSASADSFGPPGSVVHQTIGLELSGNNCNIYPTVQGRAHSNQLLDGEVLVAIQQFCDISSGHTQQTCEASPGDPFLLHQTHDLLVNVNKKPLCDELRIVLALVQQLLEAFGGFQ